MLKEKTLKELSIELSSIEIKNIEDYTDNRSSKEDDERDE